VAGVGALDDAAAETLVRASLAEAGEASLRVNGRCLEPRLADGERVRLVAPERHAPRFGDVVLARGPDGLRLHRLVWPPPGLRSACVRTQADRARFPDAALGPGAILATAVAVERAGRELPVRDARQAARLLWRGLVARLGQALGVRQE
jgi:hypothetical protein